MGGTWLTKGAVVTHCGLAIEGGEAQGCCSSQGPGIDEFID